MCEYGIQMCYFCICGTPIRQTQKNSDRRIDMKLGENGNNMEPRCPGKMALKYSRGGTWSPWISVTKCEEIPVSAVRSVEEKIARLWERERKEIGEVVWT